MDLLRKRHGSSQVMFEGHEDPSLQVRRRDRGFPAEWVALPHKDPGLDLFDLMELQIFRIQQASDQLLGQVGGKDDAQVGKAVEYIVNDGIHPGLLDGETKTGIVDFSQQPDERVHRKRVTLGGHAKMHGGLHRLAFDRRFQYAASAPAANWHS